MIRSLILLFAVTCLAACTTEPASAQDKPESSSDKVASIAKRLNKRQQYELKYKMTKGEKIRWTVEHVVATRVQMAGEAEESSSRSETKKLWTVNNVDNLGNMTFVHSIESINMWQKVGEEKPVTFDSTKDKEAPEEYEIVAGQVGKPLAMFSIDSKGKILDRKSSLKENSFGVGKVTLPLPAKPISIGQQWHALSQLQATDENGTQKKLKARILYELMEVRGQNASIKFKTEVLTPITSEKVRSTIMQQMTEGYVIFNMELGRPIKKQVEWDEKAQGFEGPDSLLTYVGRMTETIILEDTKKTSATTQKNVKSAKRPARIKTKDDGPVMRK